MTQIKQAISNMINELDYTFKGKLTEVTLKVAPSIIRDFNIEVREELGKFTSLDNSTKVIDEKVTFVGVKINGVQVNLVEDKG
jgi:hypothetical protein